MKRIIVIGAGAAGMMAAGAAAVGGAKVCILEKNSAPGKKLLLTGGGRCNITNIDSAAGHMAKTLRNPRFLHSALRAFGPEDTLDFFRAIGIETKVGGGGRVYPVSEDAEDVVATLHRHLRGLGVDFKFGRDAAQILRRDAGFEVAGLGADAVIVATGGLAAPHTGSDGAGYGFARAFGHNVTKLYPSLVPLVTYFDSAALMGLSVNAALTAFAAEKAVFKGRGDMIFTHNGISGPVVLAASAHLAARMHEKPRVVLDFAPEMNEKELSRVILDIFGNNPNKGVKNALMSAGLLPEALWAAVLAAAGTDGAIKTHNVGKVARKDICRCAKAFALDIKATAGFGPAVITCGGVDLGQINPATMESKLVPQLYFAGEVLDVDALTGGYNLQIAFATGYLAGRSAGGI